MDKAKKSVAETERIFAERLLQVMRERSLSYKQVEVLTGVPDSSIHDYTSCKVSVPLETAKKIADGLDTGLSWMIGESSRLEKKEA
jgi:transcriptional regulator with XRE-family HTH domain